MRKPKDPTKQDAFDEPAELQRHPELQLQPVVFDPPRWAERAKLQSQWRELNSIERPDRLH